MSMKLDRSALSLPLWIFLLCVHLQTRPVTCFGKRLQVSTQECAGEGIQLFQVFVDGRLKVGFGDRN